MADSQDVRTAVDRLSRKTEEGREPRRSDAPAARTLEEQLGLRFKRGDNVIDVATGQRGAVHSGRRSESTGVGVYMVHFNTGFLTHRDERELELDRPAAPAPGR